MKKAKTKTINKTDNLTLGHTPLVFYVWIILNLLFVSFLVVKGMIWWGVIFYGFLVSALIYIIFARYPCKIFLTKQSLKFQYVVPWIKDIDIQVAQISNFDYKKGFYDLMAPMENSQERYYKITCFDTISFKYKSGSEQHVNLNTRLGDFRKIRQQLSKAILSNRRKHR